MRTKPELHTRALRLVLMMGWLSGLFGADLLAQPSPDPGGGGSSTNGIPEAPTNGLYYARLNAAWKDFAPGLYSMQADAPEGGGYYARSDLDWKLITSTVTGGTLDVLVAAAAEFQGDGLDGTLIPRNSSHFIALNHLYDPDGLITGLDPTNRTFRVQTGTYQVTVIVPMCVTGVGPGNNRVPYTISLWDVSAATNIYYSSYTLYDEDRTQVTSVFMPIFEARGDRDYAIRVQNFDVDQDLVAGLDNEVAGLANHYTEVIIMKLSGAVSLPATTWAVTNLLVNTALETGQLGQAIGYTSPGVVGPITVSGPSGLPNVLIGVDDIATLTNTVVPDLNGIERVLVSEPGSSLGTFYQVGINAEDVLGPFTAAYGGTYTDLGDNVHAVITDGSSALRSGNNPTMPGGTARITVAFEIQTYGGQADLDGVLTWNASYESGGVWLTPTTISTNWQWRVQEYDWVQSGGIIQINTTELSTGAGFKVRNWQWSPVTAKAATQPFNYPSAINPFYEWRPIGIEGPPRVASATIVDPELVYASSQVVPLLSVETDWAPNGIEVRKVFLKTDAASTYSLIVQHRPSPTGSNNNIATVATSSSLEAESAALSVVVPAGSIIMFVLPSTDVTWMQGSVAYTVLP